jgi:hypothetical protein
MILEAGMAMIPPATWTRLLPISNMVKTAQTYLVIITNQRVILARTKSFVGKYTPDTIILCHQYERSDIQSAAIEGNAAVLQTTHGQVKLVGISVLGTAATAPDFLPHLVSELNQRG